MTEITALVVQAVQAVLGVPATASLARADLAVQVDPGATMVGAGVEEVALGADLRGEFL